jgi:hypothetical protein
LRREVRRRLTAGPGFAGVQRLARRWESGSPVGNPMPLARNGTGRVIVGIVDAGRFGPNSRRRAQVFDLPSSTPNRPLGCHPCRGPAHRRQHRQAAGPVAAKGRRRIDHPARWCWRWPLPSLREHHLTQPFAPHRGPFSRRLSAPFHRPKRAQRVGGIWNRKRPFFSRYLRLLQLLLAVACCWSCSSATRCEMLRCIATIGLPMPKHCARRKIHRN